jgi:hypothetical protein
MFWFPYASFFVLLVYDAHTANIWFCHGYH